jgi:2-oxoglutarate dehydrogenase complex dehydrogenase (E1) component-like enzyme
MQILFIRSSRYSSDVGKMIECPVFHVNGDYPEVSWPCMKRGKSEGKGKESLAEGGGG